MKLGPPTHAFVSLPLGDRFFFFPSYLNIEVNVVEVFCQASGTCPPSPSCSKC